jgi:hypothetical protein
MVLNTQMIEVTALVSEDVAAHILAAHDVDAL